MMLRRSTARACVRSSSHATRPAALYVIPAKAGIHVSGAMQPNGFGCDLPLPSGEVGAQRRVRGMGPIVSIGPRTPSGRRTFVVRRKGPRWKRERSVLRRAGRLHPGTATAAGMDPRLRGDDVWCGHGVYRRDDVLHREGVSRRERAFRRCDDGPRSANTPITRPWLNLVREARRGRRPGASSGCAGWCRPGTGWWCRCRWRAVRHRWRR
jgi:hypothetical protein